MTAPPFVARSLRALIAVLACSLAYVSTPAARVVPRAAIIGIAREVGPVETRLRGRETTHVRGVTFTTGLLDDMPVVVARSGVGKVGAALTTTLLIDHYAPTAVVFSGTAGAIDPDLVPGDVIVATGVAHHDAGIVTAERFVRMGTRRLTGERGPVLFPADPSLLEAARRVARTIRVPALPGLEHERPPSVREGVIVTGDAFLASGPLRDEIRRELQAVAVEMEGAAVVQVCTELQTPALVIRSITDRANATAESDYRRFIEPASANAALVATATLQALRQTVSR